LNGHSSGVNALVFASPSLLISGSKDSSLHVWDLTLRSCKYVLLGHEGVVVHLAYADGLLLSGSLDATARLWDLETASCKHIFRGHSAYVGISAFAKRADGIWKIATSSSGGELRIWDVESG
jgi:F-box and WD-40 domain protein CDC4